MEINKNDLVLKFRDILHREYWNGVSLNYDSIIQKNDYFEISLDFILKERTVDKKHKAVTITYTVIKNIGIIKLSKSDELIFCTSHYDLLKNICDEYEAMKII